MEEKCQRHAPHSWSRGVLWNFFPVLSCAGTMAFSLATSNNRHELWSRQPFSQSNGECQESTHADSVYADRVSLCFEPVLNLCGHEESEE